MPWAVAVPAPVDRARDHRDAEGAEPPRVTACARTHGRSFTRAELGCSRDRELMVGPRHARMTVPVTSSGVIDRPRLIPLLDGWPVSVLAGMAGFGKSTLLSATVARHQLRGAALWLTLDESDRDPVRLVSDLLSAVRLAGVR